MDIKNVCVLFAVARVYELLCYLANFMKKQNQSSRARH